MSSSQPSIAAQLLQLKSRDLRPADYLDEMRKLADVEGDAGIAGEESFMPRADGFDVIDRFFELRSRIATLKRKVSELEAFH